jgi:hypothetical protein
MSTAAFANDVDERRRGDDVSEPSGTAASRTQSTSEEDA